MRDRTPYLNSLASSNNQVQLRSVLPSVTCVNFGCMITGAFQKTTGITTFDSELACEDLCSVLRANGRKSGGFGRKNYTGNRLLGRYADFSVSDRAPDADVIAGLKAGHAVRPNQSDQAADLRVALALKGKVPPFDDRIHQPDSRDAHR